MKKLLTIIFCFFTILNAQEYSVEKLSGTVKYLEGTSERWQDLVLNQNLNPSTLVLAEKNSFVKLTRENEIFVLSGDAAIHLNYLKKISVKDLILALTLEEIRNIPKIKNNNLAKNTAVYGSQTRSDTEISNSVKTLGEQKISGARQLSRSGYKESSIIAAKEVFRNYPKIADMFNERIYFADLLGELELYEEALEDYKNISNLDLNETEREILEKRIENTSSKLMENN